MSSVALTLFGAGAYGVTMYYVVQYMVFASSMHAALPEAVKPLFLAKGMDDDDDDDDDHEGAGDGAAVVKNVLLLVVFFAQHLVMARGSFKKAVTKVVPWQMERNLYCLATSWALRILILEWTPMPTVVFELPTKAALAAHLFGWALVVVSTFCIDHFELFGIAQHFHRDPPTLDHFVTRGTYRLVRHPIMTGWLTAFWFHPTYTQGRLLFAVANTAFILFTVHLFEEPDLEKHIGEPYTRYKNTVPAYVPACPFNFASMTSSPEAPNNPHHHKAA